VSCIVHANGGVICCRSHLKGVARPALAVLSVVHSVVGQSIVHVLMYADFRPRKERKRLKKDVVVLEALEERQLAHATLDARHFLYATFIERKHLSNILSSP
jgi:hypothetical protein